MAKDTEKLIRQLSLISFLMAERRPVTALEIKQEVEGYSGMNDDAFARRFYADRAELESLGIELKVDKPAEGYYEAENYSLPTAIFRRKTILFDYYTMGRDAVESRKVDPYHLLFQHGQYYLVGYSHERDAVRVFRLTRIRGKVGYSSKAEHDFPPPENFDPRIYATRAPWQLGDSVGSAR